MGESMANDGEIRAIIENWAYAVRAQDVDGAVSRHSDDMLLFDVPLPVQSRGIVAYRESWGLFFDNVPKPVVFDLSELSITSGDDVAFAHALLRCQAYDAGESEDLVIRLTVCLRKVSGQWTVVHEHHSEAAA